VFLGDFSNDRQLEMAAESRNTYITETMRDTIKISTANCEVRGVAIVRPWTVVAHKIKHLQKCLRAVDFPWLGRGCKKFFLFLCFILP